MAGATGIEPATSDVTGRRSNQLNYNPAPGRVIRLRVNDARLAGLPAEARSPSAFARRASADSLRVNHAQLAACQPKRDTLAPREGWWAVQDLNL